MRRSLCAIVALSISLVVSPTAFAAGFYNMPTNLQQCFGVGFGPGYHAPLLLGFPLTAKTASQPIRWTGPYPPRAAHNGFAAPSAFVAAETPVVTAPHHPMVTPPMVEHPAYAAPPVMYSHEANVIVAPANDPYAGHEVVPTPQVVLPRGG